LSATGAAAIAGVVATGAALATSELLGAMFPVFKVAPDTVAMQAAAALGVGVAAAIVPAVRAARVRIVDGLRYIG